MAEQLDQQNTAVTGAQHYVWWQSFTAGLTGTLTKISVYVFYASEGTAKIYTGEGAGGDLLDSAAYDFDDFAGWVNITFSTPAAVTSGQQYTMYFDDPWLAGLNTTYTAEANPYANGRCDVGALDDIAFKTYVTTDRYWVGGTGDWSDDTNHWAAVSGGSPNTGNLPSEVDSVFIDEESGFGEGGTITIDEEPSFDDFTSSSGDTYTIDGTEAAVNINIYGSLALEAGITFTNIATINFSATTTGKTINTAGLTLGAVLNFGATGGGWTLLNHLTTTSGFAFEYGRLFDADIYNVTANDFYFNGDPALTCEVAMGSGTWTATGADVDSTSGNKIWFVEDDDITITCETSTVKFTDASSNAKTFVGSAEVGHIYNNLWLTGAGTGSFIIVGANTFNDIKVDTPPHTVKFTESTTTTVTTFTVSGTDGKLITIDSVNGATQHILSKSSGTVDCDYLDISNSNAAGGATWNAGLHSLDTANNDGWIFAPTNVVKDIIQPGIIAFPR